MKNTITSKKDCSCYQKNGYCSVSCDKCNPLSVKCRKNNNICSYSIVVFDAPVTMQPKNLLWETAGKVYYRTESNLVSVEKKMLQKEKNKRKKNKRKKKCVS
mgnify:FL=1|nr:hypothetical protein [uncultured Agathobacter sp.]